MAHSGDMKLSYPAGSVWKLAVPSYGKQIYHMDLGVSMIYHSFQNHLGLLVYGSKFSGLKEGNIPSGKLT